MFEIFIWVSLVIIECWLLKLGYAQQKNYERARFYATRIDRAVSVAAVAFACAAVALLAFESLTIGIPTPSVATAMFTWTFVILGMHEVTLTDHLKNERKALERMEKDQKQWEARLDGKTP